MVILKAVLLFLICNSFMSIAHSFVASQVEVKCINIVNCENYKVIFNKFKNTEMELSELKSKMKLLSVDPSIKHFSYELYRDNEIIKLEVSLHKKMRIQDIEVVEINNLDGLNVVNKEEIKQLLPIKEGMFLIERNEKLVKSVINEYLTEKGISKSKIIVNKITDKNKVSFQIKVEINNYIKIKDIKIELASKSSIERLYINDIIRKYKGKNWDKLRLKLDLDTLSGALYEEGFYFSNVTSEVERFNEDNVVIRLKVDLGPQVSFKLRGVSLFSKQELLKLIKEYLKADASKFNVSGLSEIVKLIYKKNGLYKTKVNTKEIRGLTKFKDKYHFFYLDITEGVKLKIENFEIKGLSNFSKSELMKLYYTNASAIVERNYLDEEYLETFREKVKKFYLNKGYLFFSISEAQIQSNLSRNTVNVKYLVKEFKRTKVKQIEINGIDEEITNTLISKLKNKLNEGFRVLDLEKDIDFILNEVKEAGYYYAKYESVNERDILIYNKEYSLVTIKLNINSYEKTRLKDLIYTGHESTKKYVVEREIKLKRGDTITPSKIIDIRNRLNSLGLFSSIKITPVQEEDRALENTNLLIHLVEKDFGLGEISLGYRTDTGVRGALGINYNNLWGKNWTLSSKLESNYRLNLSTLDERRIEENKRFIEWNANVGILFPYLVDIPIRTEVSTSFKKKRHRVLDAKIFTMQMKNTYDLGRFTTLSLKYQLDTVNQYDATNIVDNDKFKIGSITPGLTFDFRDNPINPRKGAFFGLSWEIANPSLGSNDEEDSVVNFDKIVSRNKFYYPLSLDYGLALAVSLGKESNNIEEGAKYIPSLRVFRLDGQDVVRGFSDSEINLLDSGVDISSVSIDNEAYFLNMKLEIRHFINDLMVAGLFVDAGRIYQSHFKPLELRSSFGATFKFITPVGSLNFDYGVKLKRELDAQSNPESFGRFHMSIGFF